MNLAIGETTAEHIKIAIGCAQPLMTENIMEIRGRDLVTGLPQTLKISSVQVQEAMQDCRRCKTNFRKNATRTCF